jgi:tryptophan-rich sensory protein
MTVMVYILSNFTELILVLGRSPDLIKPSLLSVKHILAIIWPFITYIRTDVLLKIWDIDPLPNTYPNPQGLIAGGNPPFPNQYV